MVHRNAPLSETGRLRLARCVVEEGWSLRRAAERFQVSVTTAGCWEDSYRELGTAGRAAPLASTTREPIAAAVGSAPTTSHCGDITFCTPRSMATPGWPTPNCCSMSARRPPRRFGHAPTRGSTIAASRYEMY